VGLAIIPNLIALDVDLAAKSFSFSSFILFLDVLPAQCRGLVACLCVVGLWKKNYICRKTVAIHNVFKKKAIKLNSQLD